MNQTSSDNVPDVPAARRFTTGVFCTVICVLSPEITYSGLPSIAISPDPDEGGVVDGGGVVDPADRALHLTEYCKLAFTFAPPFNTTTGYALLLATVAATVCELGAAAPFSHRI
jgi:hypothetical protein